MSDNEFSEIQAIDFALGAYIIAAFNGINAATGPKQWREFLTRASNKKVYRDNTDGPAEFLKTLSASGKTETTLDGVKTRLPQLPLCYYFRKPGMTNGEGRNFPHRVVTNEAEEKAFEITMSQLLLDYHIVFASWDTLSLDKMQLAWYAYMLRSSRFPVQYEIAGEALEVNAVVSDPKTVVFSDVSIPKSDGRLYAVDSVLTIETSIFFGAEVTHPASVILQGQWTGEYTGGGCLG